MFQHSQEEKLLGALAQLCTAKQLAPPWESNNVNRRKGGRAARRKSAAMRATQNTEMSDEVQVVRLGLGLIGLMPSNHTQGTKYNRRMGK